VAGATIVLASVVALTKDNLKARLAYSTVSQLSYVVLGAALGAVLGMFAFNKLPTYHHPLFRSENFTRVTDDGLFIAIEAWDPKYDDHDTAEFLSGLGAVEVEHVPIDDPAEDGDGGGAA